MSSIIPGFVPLITCAVTWLYVWTWFSRTKKPIGKRAALLVTAAAAGVWLVLGTEFLSFFRQLKPWPIFFWWLAPAIVIAARFFIDFGFKIPPLRIPLPRGWMQTSLSVVILLLWMLSLFVAWIFPPNTSDVRGYHVPRQVIWMQQASVRHFPSQEFRQLYNPPLAEFAGLHLMVMTHSDQLSNLPQWLALIGCAIAISLIVKQVGGDRLAQLFAVIFISTLPTAFMQASSAKNDLVVAFWVLSFLSLLITMRTEKLPPLPAGLAVGVLMGLAFLTKGTAFIYLMPVAVCFARSIIGYNGVVKCVAVAAIALAPFVLVNAGHWTRNVVQFHNPLTPTIANQSENRFLHYGNQVHSPSQFASNVIRNLALHAGTRSTTLNTRMESAVRWFHDRVLHISADDERTTWPTTSFGIRYLVRSEDSVAAPLHLLIVFIVLVATLLRKLPATATIVASAVLSFLLFCLMLKWQPWHMRLHIPIFFLFAIPVGLLSAMPKMRLGGMLFTLISLWILVPTILRNDRRAMWEDDTDYLPWKCDRDSLLYRDRTDAARAAANEILNRKPKVLGITYASAPDCYELLRLVIFDKRWHGRIVYANVWDETLVGDRMPDKPDLIVSTVSDQRIRPAVWERDFIPIKTFGPYTVLINEEQTWDQPQPEPAK